MDINLFQEQVLRVCSPDTSIFPEDWSNKKPVSGHCAIVALLAQDVFGGIIVKVSLSDTEYKKMRSHFFNIIEGIEHDFTLSQFNDMPYNDYTERHESVREKILEYPGTMNRYKLLKSRLLTL